MRKHAPAGASYEKVQQRQREHQRRRVDALVLMASQSLESASTYVNTADRYQEVVHVDSQVLSGEVHAKPTGEPDCYIEKEEPYQWSQLVG